MTYFYKRKLEEASGEDRDSSNFFVLLGVHVQMEDI